MQMHSKQQQHGFSLIEMLVSLSIFTIVVTMSVGTLLVLIDANGRAQSMQLVMTNLTFALDSMTREVRTGYNWHCDSTSGSPTIPPETGAGALADCDGGTSGNVLSIVESGTSLTSGLANSRVTYWFDDDHYGTDHGAILRQLADESWVPLTGREIRIDEMHFVVSGTSRLADGDTTQPTATIYIKGTAGEPGAATSREFSAQTTVTQRLLDV